MAFVLSTLKSSLTDEELTPLQRKRKFSPNANHQKQPRFHSTRKKRKTSSSHWAKPNLEDEMSICRELSSVEVTFCGVCFKEDNDDTKSSYIEWIQCSKCDMWIHLSCSNIHGDEHLCHNCTPVI